MEGNQFHNYNQGNYDPNSVANQTSTVIMFVVVNDISVSIRDYVNEMNTACKEIFMQDLKNSHRKNDIMMKCVVFKEDVEHRSGFMPILNLDDDYLKVEAIGHRTALYWGVYEGLQHAMSYRTDLENQGIEVRTCIFIVTDGDNNAEEHYADKVRTLVDGLKKKEEWINSFNITLMGVGQDANFRHACVQMGLDPDKCLVKVGKSASEIRKQMGVVSQSVSSSTAGANVSF